MPGQPTGKQCYSIKKERVTQTYPPLLAIKRIQSKPETDLISLFETKVTGFNYTDDFVAAKFELQKLINTQSIQFDETVPVEWFVDETTKMRYEG